MPVTFTINGEKTSNPNTATKLLMNALTKGIAEQVIATASEKAKELSGKNENTTVALNFILEDEQKEKLQQDSLPLNINSIISCLRQLKDFAIRRKTTKENEKNLISAVRDFIPKDFDEQKFVIQMIQNKTVFLKDEKLVKSENFEIALKEYGFDNEEIKKIVNFDAEEK
ncbi:MAG: hypothetical protein IJ530_02015 [Treponema sp.]|uniref:hypothetical protein n=1 Tax=Treponema sp. TaxID=166 RepID=UPI0025EB6E89|nr:hypothetical protein [Treponema sp.]MBQ8678517.1 hypothetical protein [Treponema sp.]